MTKRITGTFGYTVDDGAEQYADSIAGAMFVQIDENVVHQDDSLNEHSILTSDVAVDFEVQEATREQALRLLILHRKCRDEIGEDGLELVREHLRTYGPETDDGLSQALVDAFPEITHEVMEEVMAGDTEQEVLSLTDREQHRETMRRYMHNAHQEIAGLLHYWHTNDLPGEFLSGPEYPFTESLEEVESRVGRAAEVLGHPLVVDDPIMRIWDGMTDDEIDKAVTEVEKVDGIGRWHYAGQRPGAACGAGEAVLTTGDTGQVSCHACLQLIAEDEGEYVGALARFTTLIDNVTWDRVDDVQVAENDALLLMHLKDGVPMQPSGYSLGISDYTSEDWDVYLYLNREETEGNLCMHVTESIGKVDAADETQMEVGRRISYYLTTEQHNIDKEALRRRKEESQ